MTGLAAAWRLKQAAMQTGTPLELTLYEASARVGGVIETDNQNGCLLEWGPDSILSEKPRGVGLIRELGLDAELIGTSSQNRRSFIVRGQRLHPVPEGFHLLGPSRPWAFLRSPLLSWRGKCRAMLEPFIPGAAPEDESLASFVRRRFGPEMLARFAQPLVAGIYAADPERLSLQATFPQFLDMERRDGSVIRGLQRRRGASRHASGARYSLFVTLKSGLSTLAQALADKLAGEIRTGTPVEALRQGDDGRWELRVKGSVVMADAVLVATPSSSAATLLRDVDPALAHDLAAITCGDSATVCVIYKEANIAHPLDGFGFVSPAIENRRVPACSFLHRKYPGRTPAGLAVLKVFMGGDASRPWLDHEDTDVVRLVVEDLTPLLGLRAPPQWSGVRRYRQAMPQYSVGHVRLLQRIQGHASRHAGLFLAGNWQTGVGIPDCIARGEDAASRLMAAML